jgi:hypothetical protein
VEDFIVLFLSSSLYLNLNLNAVLPLVMISPWKTKQREENKIKMGLKRNGRKG